MRRNSLRRRVHIAFVIFAAILVAVTMFSAHGLFHLTEDRVTRRQLDAAASHLLGHPELLEQGRTDMGIHMKAYVGLEAVPSDLRQRLGPLGGGWHEFEDPRDLSGDRELHVLVRGLAQGDERLYLVFDATSLDSAVDLGTVYLSAIGISLLIASLVGIGAGRLLAERVLKPVTELTDELRQSTLEDLPQRLYPHRYGEEVQCLAEALVEASERLRGFVSRERQFTANASHELRTPITVIRGAAELLETQIDHEDEAKRRVLARIQRAVAAMEETVELFLALSREGELASPSETFTLSAVVAQVVDEQKRYLGQRPVEVVLDIRESVQVEARPRALAVVLGNLIGNAFGRTLEGRVVMGWQNGELTISDTGPGLPDEILHQGPGRHSGQEPGHGLGLSIVSSLCERCGWQLHLRNAVGGGTVATLKL